MEALMTVRLRALGKGSMVASCLLLALGPSSAQNGPRKAANSAEATRAVLAEKAHALEARGRPDMAIQLWQQILLSDPNNTESLEGLARDLKMTGSDKAIEALERLRKAHPNDPNIAKIEGLASTRAESDELRDYLKAHPRDAVLAERLKENKGKLARMNTGVARTPAERAAFAALNAKHLDEAEKRFTAILHAEPNNGRAAAGMGFLRMQQSNFGDAITYLSKAEANGFKDRTVVDGLAASHFWFTMGEAAQALDQNRLDDASEKYREALIMRPRSPEALNGLAGLLTRQQQYAAATLIYDQLVRVQPDSADGWRGLFLAYARDNQNATALAVEARLPAAVKLALSKDPDYLRSLASIYLAAHRTADAERVLAEALELPFPGNGSTLKADTKLEYAAILTLATRYSQAETLYAQLLIDDPGNLAAWMGLIGAHHEMGQDEQAIGDVKKMPPATYEAAIGDAGFLTMLGSIYQQANQFEVAQGLLERAVKLEMAAGRRPGAALQMQLADIYLARNDTERAFALYQQVLSRNPELPDAWKGLIAALVAANRNSDAIEQMALIPAPVRKQLDGDIEFVQTEASLYAVTGDMAHAVEAMNRVQLYYAKLHTTPPAAIEIQNAWLLLNTNNDRLLYAELMRLDGRGDLTTAQRETVEDIWANWSVRRAGAAMDNGNVERAVKILDAASQAFPDNLTVRKAVAGGYVQVGRAKESLALYKTIPMQDATASDFQGAIGAALAANDRSQAELWLRQAMEQFQHDPAILSLAARYEQARGDNQRAADYYRASLAAMPAASPQERLTHTLVYPEQDTRAHRAVTAADLERLLDPNDEPFAKTTKLPPSPAYGPDPYSGSVPVGPNRQPAQLPTQASHKLNQTGQQASQAYPPAANKGQTPAPVYVPQAWTRTRTRIASQTDWRARNATSMDGRNHGFVDLAFSRPRLRSATFQFNPRNRFQMRAGSGSLRRASFVPRAVSAARAQLAASAPRPDGLKRQFVSLVAENRNAEAFEMLAGMTATVRAQLESDVEFLPAEADLYIAAGEVAHAAALLSRADDLCLRRHAAVPSALELKRAFLLDNLGDDQALRLLLERLAERTDLTASQRRQVEGLWAHSTVRIGESLVQNRLTTQPAAQAASQSPYAGRMKLPPAEETVDSTGPETSATPTPGLRITAQPMGPPAAQAQALFADQTDGQLTQGSAEVIHSLPNSPVGSPANASAAAAGTGQYNVAQYTPSAQEAVTGAYSAPRQQGQTTQGQPTAPQQAAPAQAKPAAARSAVRRKKKAATTAATAKASQPQPVPQTLGQAPAAESTQQPQSAEQVQVPAELPAPPSASATDTGLTDEDLQQRNLPPLRGPWIRIQRQANPMSPREEAEMQLRSIESGYSPWLGGAGVLNYRAGSLGYDHLAALEAPFEASMPLGYNTRVTIVAKPVFLDSGQADGSSVITVLGASSAGSPLALITIPQPMGTLIDTALTLPAQQSAVGVGGEVQLAFPHLALAGGYTPEGFLVATFTGRVLWKPGPFTLNFSRDPVKDTQLSYAGLRDPSGSTLGSQGQIWGGIVANQGQGQFAHGDAESGFYVSVGGQYLTGRTVETNTRFDGDGGAYWRIKTMPEYGNLSIGANFFAMHYAHNEDAFTYGMGGYFSPQSYFLANVPFTWVGHYGPRWHYDVLGSLGVQAFEEQSTPLFPLASTGLENSVTVTVDSVTYGDLMLPAKTSVDANYDLRSHLAYQIGPHWFAGGFFSANNSRNYSAVSTGFSIHYMFRAQPSTAAGPTGIFPTDGLRPFTVP